MKKYICVAGYYRKAVRFVILARNEFEARSKARRCAMRCLSLTVTEA